jgi:hypothetical protein
MKYAISAVLTVALFLPAAFGAGKGPEIRIVDNQVSIQAEAVPLARLMRLLDQATGMTSKVPPELANRNISVRFSDLKFDEAIRKLFEGQSLDYFMVPGQSITITGMSKTYTAQAGPAPYSPPQQDNPFAQENLPFMPSQQPPSPANQPAMIQTPFGPIQNPNRQVQGQQQQPNSVAPMVVPGQTGNPFSTSQGLGGLNTLPTMQTNPFGSPTTTAPSTTPSGLPTSSFPTSQPRPNPNP